MAIDFQKEEPAIKPKIDFEPIIDFEPDPTYMSRVGPEMHRVIQDWGVAFAKPGEDGLNEAEAASLNRTVARLVRKEAEKRADQGVLPKIGRGAQKAAIGLAESAKDPVTLGLIALSVVAPEVGVPIFAGMGAKTVGQTAGSLSVPGANTVDEATEKILTAGVMALPIGHTAARGVKNYRGAVAESRLLAEEPADTAASEASALEKATRASVPPGPGAGQFDFVERPSWGNFEDRSGIDATTTLKDAGLPEPPGTTRPARLSKEERPPDIIDDIQDSVTKRISLTSALAIQEDFVPPRELKKLFAKEGGEPLDSILDTLHRGGRYETITTEGELLDAIHDANQVRTGASTIRTREQQVLDTEEAALVDFEKTAMSAKRKERPKGVPVEVGQLKHGDEFEIAGNKVKVKDLVWDENQENLAAVVLEDGRRFGVQTVDARRVIYPDEGTLKGKEPEPVTAAEDPWASDAAAAAALEERAGVHGDAPYLKSLERAREGEAPVGMNAADAKAAVGEVLTRLPGAPQTRVVQHVRDLPPKERAIVENDLRQGFRTSGMLQRETGTVWIVADHLRNAEHAASVTFEEGLGHAGMQRLLKPQDYGELFEEIRRFKPMEMQAIVRDYRYDLTRPADRVNLVNEYVAKEAKRLPETDRFWRKLKDVLLRAIRRAGLTRAGLLSNSLGARALDAQMRGLAKRAAGQLSAIQRAARHPNTGTVRDLEAHTNIEASTASGQEAPGRPPGLVSGTQAEAWADRTIAEGQNRLHTGLDPELLAAYAVKGAALIERGVRRWAEWSATMIREFGDAIRPHLRRLWDEANLGITKVKTDETELKQRKLAARAQVSPEVPAAQQERLKEGPESFYQQQRTARVEDAVKGMKSEELATVPMTQPDGPNNIWVAARLELYRRNVADGNHDAAWAIMEETMKAGTSLGQLVNQFKLLSGATADGVVLAVNKRLEAAKLPPLRPSEHVRVRTLADKSIAENTQWKAAERTWAESPSDENFERVFAAKKAAELADLQLQQRIHAANPRSFWDMLITLQQGNKITTMSQGRNIVGNLASLWLRAPTRGIAAMVDMVDSYMRARPREVAAAPHKTIPAALAASVRSVPQAGKVLINGVSDWDLSKADVHQGMRPLVALRDLLAGEAKGKPLNYKLLLAMEASPLTWFPTATLRLLGAFDLPSREAARGRLVAEAMVLREKTARKRIQQLSGKNDATLADKAELEFLRKNSGATHARIRQASLVPELFFSPKELARLEAESRGAVFQQKNKMTAMLGGFIHQMPGPLRWFVRGNLPFITTPINVISEILSFTPIGALANMYRYGAKGDGRNAKLAAGKFIAGSTVMVAAHYLYQRGVLSAPLDQPDTQQKERMMAGDVMPPNHINLSALERLLSNRESTTWRKGDRTVDYTYLGGIGGALVSITAATMRAKEKLPGQAGLAEVAMEGMKDSIAASLGYAVNQSFLKGTSDALEAITKGNFDQWWSGYVRNLADNVTPAQLESINRTVREFKPEVRGDTFWQNAENVMKNRLGVFTRSDDALPYKRDLWGRPLRETPEGASPWLYQNFDVSKTRTIEDPLALAVYSLWRSTGDPRAIPTPPGNSLVVLNKRYNLTREQTSRLQELVGQQRRRMADIIIENGRWLRAPAEGKIAVLDQVWEMGGEVGRLQFLAERAGELEEKRPPAGFEIKE